MKKFLTAAIMLLAFTAPSHAQLFATATASAIIVTPLSIVHSGDNLNFGNIAVGASGGTVVVDSLGGRTATGGLTLPPTNLGTVSAAQFTVTGNAGYTYAITVPETVVLTHTDGTNSMELSDFTSSTGAITAGAGTSILSVSGTMALNLGATLTVLAAQPAGVYTSAAFTVTVNYN